MLIKFRSFSTKLSISIIAVTGLLFLISFFIYFSFTKNTIETEVFEKSRNQLKNVTHSIDAILASVEHSIETSKFFVEQNIDNEALFKDVLSNILTTNPNVYGCTIAFEPGYYKGNNYYMLYALRNQEDPNQITINRLGGKSYDYPYMDWYLIPMLLDEGYWSEPYNDDGAADVLMSSYTQILRDENGEKIGVIVGDVWLDRFSKIVIANKPYENSYAFMLSRNGYYLVHRESDRILNETFFTATDDMTDPQVLKIGYDMINLKRGDYTFFNDDTLAYVFFEPIPRIGWSVATVSQESDVMASFNLMNSIIWFIVIGGLALIFVFVWFTIKRIAAPLKVFSRSASVIAKGDFNAPLPEIRSHDEMLELKNAFSGMQNSLKNYIEELRTTTSARERIESELAIANQIQMGMLPKVFPPFPNCSQIDLYALLKPAKEVGGDLYDFFVKGDKLFFTVGDASGKGVPASLLMAVTSSLFRSVTAHIEEPDKILQNLNDAIAESNDANMFITLFVAVLDLNSGILNYSNGGHNPPVIMTTKGETKFLSTKPNLALGVFSGFNFVAEQTKLNVGDSIFMYSDGLTEAENSDKELFSDSRLIDTLAQVQDISNPKEVIDTVENEVARFVDGNEQSDDLTMLIVNFKKIKQDE